MVATLEHQSLGVPQHPLLLISNHSRSVSNAYVITPHLRNLLFKTHLHVLAEPHSSQPTHHPARSLLNPVSQHVLPTRPVTAQMGLGSESKRPAHQPLLGSLLSSASCRLITHKPRTALKQPHPLPLITFPSKYLYPGIMPAPPT